MVSGAGAVLGAFLSRVLAEIPWVVWPFYRWGPTVAMILSVSTLLTLAWRQRTSHSASRSLSSTSFLPLYLLLLYLVRSEIDLLQAGVLLGGALALCGFLRLRGSHSDQDWLIALTLFLVPLAFYLGTLTPAVGTRDGYELQAISATLGFAHPTGYPLFPILGRLWIALFPLGSIAWRINVLCALFAAASVPLVYGTARRILGHRSFAALSALLFAFSHTLWTQATHPEKYTLNALFVALVLYLVFGHPRLQLRWLALVYGLSLTHHRTMLMLAPALALYLLWRDPGLLRRPREWMPALGIALAPLLIYLYIPWRAYAQGWAMTVPEFLRYVSGASYGPAVRLMDWMSPERSQMFWRFLVTQFGGVGIGIGILGLAGLGLARQWRFLACIMLAYLTYYVWGTVWYAYYNDVNSFIPNHLVFALWIGSGARMVWGATQSLSRLTLNRMPWSAYGLRAARAIFWSAVSLLPMWMIWTNAPQVDASDEWNLTQWGAYAVAQDIPPNATILADREKHPPLDYFARVEGRRPDVDVAILGDERAYRERLAWDLSQGRPVYLARFLPGLDGPYHLRSLGPLVEVGTSPLTPSGADAALTSVGEHLQLLGYDVEETGPLSPGETLHTTLYWQALSPVPGNYQVRLRLVGSGGQVWWAAADHPVSGMYPTASWKPGEVIPDWHEVPIDLGIPPGKYALQVGLYPPFSTEGLPFAEGQTWWTLHRVQVALGEQGPEILQQLRAIAPGKWQLLGYDLPPQAPPTGRVSLTLYWQALAPLPDYEIGTRLVVNGREEAWNWTLPAGGEYPTARWPTGKVTATALVLRMPGETGQVTVQLALREVTLGCDVCGKAQNVQRAVFYPRWLAQETTVLSLLSLTIAGHAPAASGTVNYADQILLLDTDLGTRALLPGAPLELNVRWQCTRAMEADYTLFIQLLAPDGTLKGQIDVWPRDGTLPTSAWREGETIEDRYLMYVAEDAPPGDYQVWIGWYLLGTMQRLPVLDAQGQAVDDKLALPGLTIRTREE